MQTTKRKHHYCTCMRRQQKHKLMKNDQKNPRKRFDIFTEKKKKKMGVFVQRSLIIPHSQIFFLYLFHSTQSAQPRVINASCQLKLNHRFWSLFACLYKCAFCQLCILLQCQKYRYHLSNNYKRRVSKRRNPKVQLMQLKVAHKCTITLGNMCI